MRVTFNKISQEESEGAVINAYERTSSIDTAIGLLENGEQIIVGYRDGEKVPCRLSQIYYFESVDDKTFVYCKDNVFSCGLKLYEAEEMLADTSFVRISKACILNIDVLDSVKMMINGKMEAALDNGEKLIINRHYVPAFKKKFGM